MTDFTQYIIEKIAKNTLNKFTTVLENSVKPFPLRNCIYNKVIQAGYKDKDFYNITYKQLLKIKGIGKVKANEFLSSKKHYKLT